MEIVSLNFQENSLIPIKRREGENYFLRNNRLSSHLKKIICSSMLLQCRCGKSKSFLVSIVELKKMRYKIV